MQFSSVSPYISTPKSNRVINQENFSESRAKNLAKAVLSGLFADAFETHKHRVWEESLLKKGKEIEPKEVVNKIFKLARKTEALFSTLPLSKEIPLVVSSKKEGQKPSPLIQLLGMPVVGKVLEINGKRVHAIFKQEILEEGMFNQVIEGFDLDRGEVVFRFLKGFESEAWEKEMELHQKFQDLHLPVAEMWGCNRQLHVSLLKRYTGDLHRLIYVEEEREEEENLEQNYEENVEEKGVILKFEPLSPETRWGVAEQLASALANFHASRYYHGDLKPENVVYEGEGEKISIKLIDFSTSDLFDRWIPLQGAFAYQPPEAFEWKKRGDQLPPKIDLRALGLILYELKHDVLYELREFIDDALTPLISDFREWLSYKSESIRLNNRGKSQRDLSKESEKKGELFLQKLKKLHPTSYSELFKKGPIDPIELYNLIIQRVFKPAIDQILASKVTLLGQSEDPYDRVVAKLLNPDLGHCPTAEDILKEIRKNKEDELSILEKGMQLIFKEEV